MCTLTYRLTEQGYQLFFNRDEQRTRPQAIKPTIDGKLNSAYPIDPMGGGTWIAVHESGVTLALLNYYQAHVASSLKHFTSRGVIIPSLLAQPEHIHQQLLDMDLSIFQAFQLCLFDKQLSADKSKAGLAVKYIWDGKSLTFSSLSADSSLPITSSSVDYEMVYAFRKQQFEKIVEKGEASFKDYIKYHNDQTGMGKCSVKMSRKDAKTVSFTSITVDQTLTIGHKVNVDYVDYFLPQASRLSSVTL